MLLQKKFHTILFTALLLWQLPSIAQRQYVYRSWNNQNGLPQNTVNDIARCNQGYLWAATEEGLIRFDGASFSVMNETNTAALHSSVFYEISPAKEGIWASSRNTVVYSSGGKKKFFDLRTHLQGAWIKCLEADPEGKVWMGTSSGRIFFIEGDSIREWRNWSTAYGPVEVLHHIGNALLVGTLKGLFSITGNTINVHPGLVGKQVSAIAGSANDFWVGTAEHGLYHFGKDSLHLQQSDGLKEMFVNSLTVDEKGTVWIGTRNSGYQIYDGQRFIEPAQEQYAHDGVESILLTEGGRIWLGTTSSGLVQVAPAQISMYSSEPLARSIILPIYQHANGDTWVGTAGKGVHRITGGRTVSYTTKQGLSTDLVLSLYGTKDAVFVGTSGGLHRFNLQKGIFDRHYTKDNGLTSNSTHALFADSRNRLWIHTRSGGIQYMDENERIHKLSLPSALEHSGFLAAFEDSKGYIWFGSRGAGVVRMDLTGTITRYSVAKGFPADIVYAFHEDSRGTIWMGTDKGLVYGRGNTFGLLDKADGLRFNEIYRILEDNAGYIWLSGNFGLQRIALDKLHRRLAAPSVSLSVQLYNTVDGMANAETNGGLFPAGWKMQDGSLWFPTVEGIATVQPALIKGEEKAVDIRLQGLRYGNTEFSEGEKAVIPPGVYNLELHYTSIDFSKAGDINYYFRLRGLDQKWVSAGNRRTAYFSGLPHGAYVFEVRAEQYGKWSKVAAMPFSIAPYFYQTTAFKIGVVLVSLLCIAGLVLLQRKRAREKLLEQKRITRAHLTGQEKERQHIGAELHDNINQQLATAKLYLDFAKSHEASRVEMIEKSEGVVQGVINEIRGLCRSMIPPTLKDMGLEEALQELLSSYMLVKKFDVHFYCSAQLDSLEEGLRFSLFRIAQEGLNNISKHAEAANVWLDIQSADRVLQLVLRDDGKGFDPRTVSHGLGLENMHHRLELYGGTMEIVTAPGKGCTLRISIPLHRPTGILLRRKSRKEGV